MPNALTHTTSTFQPPSFPEFQVNPDGRALIAKVHARKRPNVTHMIVKLNAEE